MKQATAASAVSVLAPADDNIILKWRTKSSSQIPFTVPFFRSALPPVDAPRRHHHYLNRLNSQNSLAYAKLPPLHTSHFTHSPNLPLPLLVRSLFLGAKCSPIARSASFGFRAFVGCYSRHKTVNQFSSHNLLPCSDSAKFGSPRLFFVIPGM